MMQRGHVMKDHKREEWACKNTIRRAETPNWLMLAKQTKDKINKMLHTTIYSLFLKLSPSPHFYKTITKLSKKDKQHNNNTQTREVYS